MDTRNLIYSQVNKCRNSSQFITSYKDIVVTTQYDLTIAQIWNILFSRVESPTPLDSIMEEKQIGRRASGPLVTRKLERSVARPCRTSAAAVPTAEQRSNTT